MSEYPEWVTFGGYPPNSYNIRHINVRTGAHCGFIKYNNYGNKCATCNKPIPEIYFIIKNILNA